MNHYKIEITFSTLKPIEPFSIAQQDMLNPKAFPEGAIVYNVSMKPVIAPKEET